MAASEWAVNRTFAERHWADAVSVPEPALTELLDAAQEQCAAYAPALPVGALPPVRYQIGCVLQARELRAAAQRDSGDVIGFGEYAIRARPLTAAVKALLRPEGKRVCG